MINCRKMRIVLLIALTFMAECRSSSLPIPIAPQLMSRLRANSARIADDIDSLGINAIPQNGISRSDACTMLTRALATLKGEHEQFNKSTKYSTSQLDQMFEYILKELVGFPGLMKDAEDSKKLILEAFEGSFGETPSRGVTIHFHFLSDRITLYLNALSQLSLQFPSEECEFGFFKADSDEDYEGETDAASPDTTVEDPDMFDMDD